VTEEKLMKRTELLSICSALAQKGIWCIPESTLAAAANYPATASLKVALSRHVKAGIITRVGKGLYLNPFANPPAFALYRLANYLRPHENMYLSLESVLSEASLISQVPSCLTFITTGVSYRFETPLGAIEFVHTEEDPNRWVGHLTYVAERQIWQASPDKALADFKRYGKNLHMVDERDERC
jgi:predicted transcriptional regulator of viral defense system